MTEGTADRATELLRATAGPDAWQGAAEALRRGFGPVAVWTGPGGGDGNALLADKGARPVDEPHQVLEEHPRDPPDAGEQLRLSV